MLSRSRVLNWGGLGMTVSEGNRLTTDVLADLRTLAMFEAHAQATLPPDVWAFACGGSSSEATL